MSGKVNESGSSCVKGGYCPIGLSTLVLIRIEPEAFPGDMISEITRACFSVPSEMEAGLFGLRVSDGLVIIDKVLSGRSSV